MRFRHGLAVIALATLLAPPRAVLSHGPHPATTGDVKAGAPGRFLAVWTETDATGAVVWRAKAIG